MSAAEPTNSILHTNLSDVPSQAEAGPQPTVDSSATSSPETEYRSMTEVLNLEVDRQQTVRPLPEPVPEPPEREVGE